MNRKEVIEALEVQNKNIEKIAGQIEQLLVSLTTIRNNNKKIISELTGNPHIDGNYSYNVEDLLLESGFIEEPEREQPRTKALISWMEANVKGQLNEQEVKQVVRNVVAAERSGKVKEKKPYLIASLKSKLSDKAEAQNI